MGLYSQSDVDCMNIVIHHYFKYIRPKLGKDSLFRLLSPLLQIFFGIPNSKEFKSKIHYNIKKNKIDILENLILEFVNKQKLLIN